MNVIVCNGAVTKISNNNVRCTGTVELYPIADTALTESDFNILWPPLVGMLVAGFIIKMLIRTVYQGAGRN